MDIERVIRDLQHELKIKEDQRRVLAARIRKLEKYFDTKNSPWWKRIWFRIDGWPTWSIIADRRAWRPWHRDRWPLKYLFPKKDTCSCPSPTTSEF